MALPTFACLLLQTTWVVDDNGGPGVDFTDLPPAIAAAADGDVLLVQPGTYSHFTLTGKGLRILGSGASGPNTAFVTDANPGLGMGRTTVNAVPTGSVLHLEGLRFLGSPAAPSRLQILGASTRATLADVVVIGPQEGTGLLVESSQVRIVRCSITGGEGQGFSSAGPALVVRNGAEVHAAGSTIQGGEGTGFPFCSGGSGGDGARVESGSQVSFGDTTVRGGDAGCCDFPLAITCGNAGHGISVDSAFVRVSGGTPTVVRGGSLSGDISCNLLPFSVPGAGIATSGAALVEVHSALVLGGCFLSPSLCGTCIPGPATSGAGITLGAPPLPVLDLTGSLTPSGSATISISQGPINSPFVIAVATVPDFVPLGPPFLGEFLLDPLAWLPLATGVLVGVNFSMTIPLGGIPPALLNVPFHFQAATLDAGSASWRMSNATVGTIRA
ncbi:MAG: hypothetical protein L0323_07845 [Planctomycetes bacterium]|nr:hypothetical protein [Planctomycetota bacterium]